MRDQRGVKNASAKLTPEIVKEMRKMRYDGEIIAIIADKYDVNPETVREIVLVRAWQHVKTEYDGWLLRNGHKINKHLPRGIEVTAALVREIFSYDPAEGILRWNIRGRAIPFGKPAGASSTRNGHLAVSIGGRDYKVQIIIWLFMTGEWPDRMVDHKDRNKQNNKWDNLRKATRSQNSMNSKLRDDNTSGHKGVFLDKRTGLCHAYINVDGKRISLGWGLTFEEASRRREEAEKKYFGEFAAKL